MTEKTSNSELQKKKDILQKKSTDYSNYWLSPEQIEALRQDSKETSRYSAGKFSKILEEKLGYKKE